MPIAHCLIRPSLSFDAEQVASAWAMHVPFASDEITVMSSELQGLGGKPYDVVARLSLPSLWSEERVETLQLTLGRAIEEVVGVASGAILVISEVLDSGQVVENGRVLRW